MAVDVPRSAAQERRTARYEPEAASVRAARRFVEEQLVALERAPLADDAGLVLSELAANAVLHARTPFEVVVVAVGTDEVRVEVLDGSTATPLVGVSVGTSTTGRGMVLVDALATRWGVRPLETGKAVWFEVGGARAEGESPAEASAEDLLAMWADLDTSPTVVVHDVPVAELLAAKEHVDDLVRELQLVALDPALLERREAEAPCEVHLARRLDVATRAFDAARVQVRSQVVRAARAGRSVVDLELVLGPDDGEHARQYRDALEEAEQLARSGVLLTRGDVLGRHAAVLQHYLDEVVRQLG
ncbi:ATP-binding protein [Quadrisphaera sp. INWT6]|uniref:ATP-binding protein n=1 Tax=Quadrisphaera sp. INWT6 TaxID=2596917 RepID=UPI0018923574|nr:ATP-binding protein [Quadrisphaera sp. INWT6]MBF5081953.1 ATP-binding protein [Quadrisphaera sp. INWT6]